jgi:hypothetical protein
MSDISVRLLQSLETLKINPNIFSKALGYHRSQTIYDIINGKVKPSYDFFKRIIDSEYSESIDIRWLISGKIFQGNDISNPEKIPPGPCQQCMIRERLIQSQQKTIENLEARLASQDGQKRKVG